MGKSVLIRLDEVDSFEFVAGVATLLSRGFGEKTWKGVAR